MRHALLLVFILGFAKAQNLADAVKRGEAVFASTCAVG